MNNQLNLIMRVGLELPSLGIETDDDVTVSLWHVEKDEEFEEVEDIMEVTANNAIFNILAPRSGRLIEMLAQEGDVIKAGNVIGIIETKEDNEIEECNI